MKIVRKVLEKWDGPSYILETQHIHLSLVSRKLDRFEER
jgi:hypothetical protein